MRFDREHAPRQNKIWLWTTVNHWKPGILAWVLGDLRSIAEGIARLELFLLCGKQFGDGNLFGMLPMVGLFILVSSIIVII